MKHFVGLIHTTDKFSSSGFTFQHTKMHPMHSDFSVVIGTVLLRHHGSTKYIVHVFHQYQLLNASIEDDCSTQDMTCSVGCMSVAFCLLPGGWS